MTLRHATLLLLALAGAGGACSGATDSSGVGQILVTPDPAYLSPGDTVTLTVDVLDTDGHLLTGLPVTFATSNATVATVSGAGVVRAMGPLSSVTVTVTTAGRSIPVPVAVFGLLDRTSLSGRPYGAAVSAGGVAYVGLLDVGKLARADLPSTAIAPAVTVGDVPTEIAFNSSGTRAYVTNQFDDNIGVVNVATNAQIDVIPVQGDPFEVIVAPGDSILYVTTNADSVYGIRLATKAVIARFPVPATANGMAARGNFLYVSTRAGGTVIEYNLRTRTIARTFAVGGWPQKLDLSADGRELYVANQAGYVQFWSLTTGTQIGDDLPLPGGIGYGLARSPANGLLFVSTAYAGAIYVIDPAARAILKTFAVGGATRRVVFDATGTFGLIPNEGGWVDYVR